MVELRGVTKRFGTNFAIKNLSFSTDKNEFVVIVGPAGAGKSTTLRMIAGILSPNYGEIYFGDRLMNQVPPERRNVSMAFENYVLYSHLTNFENLAFPLRARKIPDAEVREQVHRMAELLHIENELDRKPGYLSGGQRQRVALGRCLIRQADVYLMDEPISHLDARLKIQMRMELKNICAEKNATVLHVTHDYREAMSLADRMLVLNQGMLMQSGDPQEIYHQPKNEFVASFVGDPPMGFIGVGIESRDGKNVFRIKEKDIAIEAPEDFSPGMVDGAARLRIGIRANDIMLSGVQGEGHTVPGTVYLIEVQGHRKLVSVKLEEAIVQITVPVGQDWTVGQRVWMRLEKEHLHVFSNGKAIYHPAQGNTTRGGV